MSFFSNLREINIYLEIWIENKVWIKLKKILDIFKLDTLVRYSDMSFFY